jgi:hypothetical protein
MISTYFAYTLIGMNAGAALAYVVEGNVWKACYWAAACTLNICVLNLK